MRAGADAGHLLSAVSHQLGLTGFQKAVSHKSNEISAAKDVVAELVLRGHVVTVDALLTQRALAEAIVKKGGTT